MVAYFTSKVKPIYNLMLEGVVPSKPPPIHPELQPTYRLFAKYAGVENVSFMPASDDRIRVASISELDALSAFTGGKDGLVAAMHLRSQGLRVALYHLSGMNPGTISSERRASLAASKAAGMKLYSDPIGYRGKINPARSIMVLARMIDYGLSLGATQFTLGTYGGDYEVATEVDFWKNFQDSVEHLREFAGFVSRVSSGRLKVHTELLSSQEHAIAMVIKHGLYDAVESCCTSDYKKPYFQKLTRAKFGKVLPDHRCGVCKKCAIEYSTRVRVGLVKENPAYTEKCKEIFTRNFVIANKRQPKDGNEAKDFYFNQTLFDSELAKLNQG